jgi:DNA-binding IclR family transcriptional regulator
LVPALFNGDQLLLAAREPLEELFNETGRIVSLIVPDGDYGTICIYVRDGSDSTLIPAALGSRSPHLHAGAVGKLLLAQKSDLEIEHYFATSSPLHAYTSRTPVTAEVLWPEIRAIRQQGFAFSDQEVAEGMYGIAAPVRDRRGESLAAITLAAPAHDGDQREAHRLAVIDAARRISAQLGYRAVVALG